ncbi:glycosyltransferase family 22 protein [Microthyrium microscopicum]|uniref:Mannosyltransferase n=1 Tax=Microthyrium microscopicum TaxID=703497 RepID=A0A6A6UBY2_9PEZI|nr:glycosyltransferase family 22 protein [Microthyrium microscopicum]
MWRRLYLLLLVVRLYFALSPSYLHPDENFQGPEVVAGQVFDYPVYKTWEFTTQFPIRSTFPLWLVYGIPMLILRSLWNGIWKDDLPPYVVYWTLRVLMYTLSFVLEDWAILELVSKSWHRRIAVLLTASSYVTWTYQTHTFSNAIETLVVLWSLVLMQRIFENKDRSGALPCMVLAFLIVLGVFNRITFPAYILVPGIKLLPHFYRKPLAFLSISFFGLLFTGMVIIFDTSYYHPHVTTWVELFKHPVITPLNNFLYNYAPENLAKHGLHPFYQHFVANLPQLLGPAFPLLIFNHRRSTRLYSAVCALVVLSLFPHQEARFLIPAVPLILSSIRLPPRFPRAWIAAWTLFNLAFGALMGVYHQGGVVPAQIHVAGSEGISHVYWWKTYSPPIWLLDGRIRDIQTTDLMGKPGVDVQAQLLAEISCSTWTKKSTEGVVLVAPASATFLDQFTSTNTSEILVLEERWRHTSHINLDDLDFGDDGVWGTLARVVGRRGLVMWDVKRRC